MRAVIFANGEYGDISQYKNLIQEDDIILCADGGANYAHTLGLVPKAIIGDMDSILPEIKQFYMDKGVHIKKFPRRKDFTDIQLTLSVAQEEGAEEIIFLGTLGKRLDHTLSNLYCGIDFVEKGIKITHISPECRLYIINKLIEIEGKQGDIVSVLALSQEATGVCETGFEYSLDDALLENHVPFAVSNVLSENTGRISVKNGMLAVFHYM